MRFEGLKCAVSRQRGQRDEPLGAVQARTPHNSAQLER